ncbi:exodeoxyribonuclease VII large subunit [Flavobacterium tegetincola]|uniref:exodeoxyribonuclease VII large subunit n=1 Tax=Flavobacterium tegetincola TaxID=150172 RepID=UPI000407ABAD|nr:exodeoxyribonuclease VII large subunit [Flavobacterium tegetincola]
MSEIIEDRQIFSLLEVAKSVQKTITERYTSAFWIKAELNKLNYYSHSGHCYPELVEKRDGKVIAQIKSILWRDDFYKVNQNFLKVLQEPLKEGIKILFLAKISFDATYGLSLQIIDIDPSFTLGDLNREKQETIDRLKLEGIFELNKTRKMPLLCKRIAIISVETSKGYADFLTILDHNEWNYNFFHLLFPSILQGEKAVAGISAQLKRIEKVLPHFDAVVIIRGGGADIGLSCFNNYQLAKAIATFPIPVLTGIGHATNLTVSEMVSYQNAITPSKIAEFLIQKFHHFSEPLKRARQTIVDKAKYLIILERSKLQSELKMLRAVAQNKVVQNQQAILVFKNQILLQSDVLLKANNQKLDSIQEKIITTAQFRIAENTQILKQATLKLEVATQLKIEKERLYLANFTQTMLLLDPLNILKRGYSITRLNGKIISNVAGLEEGARIETQLQQGTLISTVNTSKND